MINAKLTKKELKDGMTYFCGYCAIQDAVKWLPEIGYNSGVYGWNCTAYACGALVLVTGYRPAGWRRLTREDCERLNAAACNAGRLPGALTDAEYVGMTPQALAVIAEMARIHQERNDLEWQKVKGVS